MARKLEGATTAIGGSFINAAQKALPRLVITHCIPACRNIINVKSFSVIRIFVRFLVLRTVNTSGLFSSYIRENMVVCRFFQQGRCSQGDCCRFEHPKAPLHTPRFVVPTHVTSQIPSSVSKAAETASPCVFFQRGTCKFGSTCKQTHDLSTAPTPPRDLVTDTRPNVFCTFFLRNACYKGAACPFSHNADTKSPNIVHAEVESTLKDGYPHQKAIETVTSRVSPSRTVIAGADIVFDDGATISRITLPTDISTIALSGIPAAATLGDIQAALVACGTHEPIETGALQIDPQTSKQSAEVKVSDGGRLRRSLISTKHKLRLNGSDVQMNSVQLGSSEVGTNRLQLSGVTCTWYEPSRTASLRYGSATQATIAFTALKQSVTVLHGRRPTFLHAQSSLTIRVGNLDVSTTVNDVKQLLRNNHPMHIELGARSHSVSKEILQQQVKRLLEKHGQLLEWSISPQLGSAKIKAYAKFANYHEALQATKQLNGSRINALYDDVLHVQHVISIKLPVSQRVLEAIKPQLQALTETSRSTNHVSIKTYDNPLKAYTQIRVSGQEKASVAQVKMQVETLLAGNIARNDKQLVAHEFFSQGAAATFLDEIKGTYGVLVLCDRRKAALRLYGEKKNLEAAQNALQSRIEEMNRQHKEVILDSVTLANAMRGRLQDVTAALGRDRVKLDITSTPKRILINGSEGDANLVRSILEVRQSDIPNSTATAAKQKEEDALCVVCWTPAEDPLRTCCGHTYCTTCLESQASCTSEFPICCLGDSGRCNTVFTLPELRRLLTAEIYSTMLETSLTTYVRSHPKNFQYCSTPDCDRFYRCSEEAIATAFDCDHCLASICTACHSTAHEGETCKEARAGRDGTDEFADWKSKNDARDCPNCSTSIQKSEGCDHMTCGSCRAHICWQCMKVFAQGPEVYAHMNKDHKGDWGLGWMRRDFE
jgi:hypothetical protein